MPTTTLPTTTINYNGFVQTNYIQETADFVENTSLYSFPNSSTDPFNTIELDLQNQSNCDALAVKYPRAWASIYGQTSIYTYSIPNAAKLKKAVEFWLWLSSGNAGHIDYVMDESDQYFDNLVPVNVINLTEQSRVPYGQYNSGEPGYYNNNQNPDREPFSSQWNRQIFRGPAADAYVTFQLNPANLNQLTVDLRSVATNNILETKIAKVFPCVVVFTLRPVYAAFDDAARLIRWVFDNQIDEYGNTRSNFVPFEFNGRKIIASDVLGTIVDGRYVTNSYSENIYSVDYLTCTEYETTHRTAVKTGEWGSEGAFGKHTY